MGKAPDVLISKLLAMKHNIPIRTILTATYDQKIKPQLLKTLVEIEKYLTIKNDIYIDIDYILEEIEFSMVPEVELVVIDSLQFVTSIVNKRTNIVKELKRLAYLSQIPIILLNNLDKDFLNNKNHF